MFSNKEVIAKLKELNVKLVKADNTNANPEINADLDRFKRSNLPVNIIAPADPDQPLILMPEIIGPEDALKALELAAGK